MAKNNNKNLGQEIELTDKEIDRLKGGKEPDERTQRLLLKQVVTHHEDAENYVSPLQDGWNEKEELFLGIVNDDLSSTAKSKVFDPRLANNVFERSIRTMHQKPKGRSNPVTKGDVGKNLFMDLVLDYCWDHANYWKSMFVKWFLTSINSNIYGVQFNLVPWWVNTQSDYIGPEMILLRIRDCYPQPSGTSINELDYFQHSAMVPFEQLKKDKDRYFNIDGDLEDKVTKSGGDTRDDDQRSKIETDRYSQTPPLDKVFPKVEVVTEYRSDLWISYLPRYNKAIRVLPNPHKDGKIPIIAKESWPLQDSIFGLGEFERGKTLQKATNSLINLYMDAVKYSIFPPIMVNPQAGVKFSTIKWGPGERWVMPNPGKDVVPLAISPLGLNTFQSTYGFLISAIANQAGTTDVSVPQDTARQLGQTATGIRFVEQRQNSRDAWEQKMIEDAMGSMYERWIDLILNKMERSYVVEVLGDALEEIQNQFPDVLEDFGGSKRAKIKKSQIAGKYEYKIETGSTLKPFSAEDLQNVNTLISLIISSPVVLQQLAQQGYTVDFGYLLKTAIELTQRKDGDKIIIKNQPMAGVQQGMGQPGQPMGQPMQPGQPGQPMQQPMQTPQMPQFNDPDIQRAAQEAMNLMGGYGGIPSQTR